MKKRLLKFIGIGLGVDVAFVAIPLLFSSVGYFLSVGKFSYNFVQSMLQDVFSGDFAAIYPFAFLGTIGICLCLAVAPPPQKDKQGQTPKEYKNAGIFVTVGVILISIGAAFSLRLGYTKHAALVMSVITLSIAVAVAITTLLITFAHRAGRKMNWRYILVLWIPVLLILLIAPPWTDMLF